MIEDLENRSTRLGGRRLTKGMVVGEMTLDKMLGKGAMGEVWRAIDPTRSNGDNPGYIALKFLPPEIGDSPRESRRVQETFQAVQALQHPNICPVYFLRSFDDFGFVLAMKYVKGMGLADFRDAYAKKYGSFPLEALIKVLTPIASALDYAHQPEKVHDGVQSVIHRDVKPENILISANAREVQLVDFGLAAQVKLCMTRVTNVQMESVGTRLYMAPEQWRGQYQDSRADQYSLAVVAYELLANRLPFEAADPFQLRECVLNEPVEPITGQPDSVNSAFAKALAKSRDGRFPSCLDFVKSLSCVFARPETCEEIPNLSSIAVSTPPAVPRKLQRSETTRDTALGSNGKTNAEIVGAQAVSSLATRKQRIVSFFGDNIVLTFINLYNGAFALTGFAYWSQFEYSYDEQFTIACTYWGSVFVIPILYFAFCEWTMQKTIGKKIAGTKVVNKLGGQPSFGQCLLRSICRLIPLEFLSYFGGNGFPVGWHDKLSGTQVVSTKISPVVSTPAAKLPPIR